MILKFATRRDTNGNTYFIVLDTERKQFSEMPSGFYHKDDYMQITRRELRAIKEKARADGYEAISYFQTL